MNVKVVESISIAIGHNEREVGSISVPATTTYTAGTLLKRATGGFDVAAATDRVIAVLGEDLKNAGSDAETVNISAITWGHVREDKLHYNAAPTTAITAAQKDALRDYGIRASKVQNWGAVDNGAEG
jgi:hypothetical protein